ncbi:MAG TPA: hypothetical protein VMV89_06090 [Candidatus Paceibacterota bacterium]|nr:hypothetical protein [Candidatus Paceibacterota bacterium]
MKTNLRQRGNKKVRLHLQIAGAFGTEKRPIQKSFSLYAQARCQH